MNNVSFSELLNNYKCSVKLETSEDLLENSFFMKRYILLKEIDSEVGNGIEMMIRYWNMIDDDAEIPVEKRKPIKIYIDSDGGDLCATFTVIDAIKMSKTPVITVNIGAAYSGGFFIFISGHHRIAYENSTFLYHEGSTINGGDAGKFQNFADFYKKQMSKLKDITLKNSVITPEVYEEKRRDDWWIEANEAIELGFADEIAKNFV